MLKIIVDEAEELKMKKNRKMIGAMKNLALVSQLGISMLVPIFGCLFLGNFLDEKLNTKPLFLFIFIVLGVGAAFVNLYKIGIHGLEKKDKDGD